MHANAITKRIRTVCFILASCMGAFLLAGLTTLAKPVNNAQPKPVAPAWPMFGGTPQRNMVNLVDKNIPISWSVKEGERKNIKWSVNLKSRNVGQPIVAQGKVFVVCRFLEDQGPTIQRNDIVCSAYRERDGAIVWQNIHRTSPDDPEQLLGVPVVDDSRIFYVTPACEVICADADTGKIQWQFDMMKSLSVKPSDYCFLFPCLLSPLVVGDLIYVPTSNAPTTELPSSNAPNLIALNKRTGQLAWKSDLLNKNLIDDSCSPPAYAIVNRVPQIIFPGGDGVIYSFEPDTGKVIWKCDCLPFRKGMVNGRASDAYFVGAPVIVDNRLYIGMGVRLDKSSRSPGWFLCLDISKRGDVSMRDYDAKATANKDSALVWAFGGGPAKASRFYFYGTANTAAVHDGLVYVTENRGYLHCLDMKTGQRYWEHDFRAGVTSPFWVDGKIYVATEDGEICVFAHSKTKRLLATIDMDEMIATTPTVANGIHYVLTHKKLFAIGKS